eukprot:508034-Rhodomonas_salina.1
MVLREHAGTVGSAATSRHGSTRLCSYAHATHLPVPTPRMVLPGGGRAARYEGSLLPYGATALMLQGRAVLSAGHVGGAGDNVRGDLERARSRDPLRPPPGTSR